MRDRLARDRSGIRHDIISFLMLMSVALGAGAEVSESELATAYLYNFSKFVRWPSDVFASANAPLVVCVYGRAPADDTTHTLEGKLAQGRPVHVERRARGDVLAGCQVVYVSVSEQSYLVPLLRSLARQPVLTVSELPGFATAGGMIGFVRLDNRLRFEINAVSAESAGLTISSQLLKLAARVIRD